MKFLDKVFAFFRKPAAAEEVAKAFEQAYQKKEQDKEMDALLDWVEHDKPTTIHADDPLDAVSYSARVAGVNAPAIWFDEVGPILSKDEALAMLNAIDDAEVKTPIFNHQLAIRKYKTQKKNWAHWKKRGK